MYLLVFAFLIIGLLGVYTQVFAIAVARMAANQTALAESMITWHEAAASLAGNVMNPASQPSPFQTKGCSLSPSFQIAGASGHFYCQVGAGITSTTTDVTVTGNGTYSNVTTTFPQLAPAYNSATYEWKSVAFQSNGYYVITFADPAIISASNPPPGFISTASAQLRITGSDLLQQLRRSAIPTSAYGYVTGSTLVTAATLPSGVQITYTNLPNTITDGAVAIISAPGLCTGC
jgi:hypothetical protein